MNDNSKIYLHKLGSLKTIHVNIIYMRLLILLIITCSLNTGFEFQRKTYPFCSHSLVRFVPLIGEQRGMGRRSQALIMNNPLERSTHHSFWILLRHTNQDALAFPSNTSCPLPTQLQIAVRLAQKPAACPCQPELWAAPAQSQSDEPLWPTPAPSPLVPGEMLAPPGWHRSCHGASTLL